LEIIEELYTTQITLEVLFPFHYSSVEINFCFALLLMIEQQTISNKLSNYTNQHIAINPSILKIIKVATEAIFHDSHLTLFFSKIITNIIQASFRKINWTI